MADDPRIGTSSLTDDRDAATEPDGHDVTAGWRRPRLLQVRPADVAAGDARGGVGVLSGTFVADGRRYALGEIEVVCDGAERAAVEELVDVYHPRLDVYEVTPAGPRDDRDGPRRLLIRVQCEKDDVHRAVTLLALRLRRERGLLLGGP